MSATTGFTSKQYPGKAFSASGCATASVVVANFVSNRDQALGFVRDNDPHMLVRFACLRGERTEVVEKQIVTCNIFCPSIHNHVVSNKEVIENTTRPIACWRFWLSAQSHNSQTISIAPDGKRVIAGIDH